MTWRSPFKKDNITLPYVELVLLATAAATPKDLTYSRNTLIELFGIESQTSAIASTGTLVVVHELEGSRKLSLLFYDIVICVRLM